MSTAKARAAKLKDFLEDIRNSLTADDLIKIASEFKEPTPHEQDIVTISEMEEMSMTDREVCQKFGWTLIRNNPMGLLKIVKRTTYGSPTATGEAARIVIQHLRNQLKKGDSHEQEN